MGEHLTVSALRSDVWAIPAECWTGCRDRECPYTHRDMWFCEGIEQRFISEQEANEASIAKAEGSSK